MITAIVGSTLVIGLAIYYEIRLDNERDKRLDALQALTTLQNSYSALYIASNSLADEYDDLLENYNEKIDENIK